MKCDQIQELILTDYIDGQLQSQALKDFEEHMLSCASCREFFAIAKQTSIEPFQKADHIELDKEKIWQDIKEEIQSEFVDKRNPLVDFIENVKRGLSMPQTVGVFAALIAVLFVTAVLTKPDNLEISQSPSSETEEITYIAYVTDDFSSDHLDENEYGTLIEEYFL